MYSVLHCKSVRGSLVSSFCRCFSTFDFSTCIYFNFRLVLPLPNLLNELFTIVVRSKIIESVSPMVMCPIFGPRRITTKLKLNRDCPWQTSESAVNFCFHGGSWIIRAIIQFGAGPCLLWSPSQAKQCNLMTLETLVRYICLMYSVRTARIFVKEYHGTVGTESFINQRVVGTANIYYI